MFCSFPGDIYQKGQACVCILATIIITSCYNNNEDIRYITLKITYGNAFAVSIFILLFKITS